MSANSTTEESESDYGGEQSSIRASDVLRADGERVVAAAGVALLAVAGTALVRILYNLPFDPVPVSPAFRSLAAGATLSVVAGSLIVLALSTELATVRVGLLFAGVFGVLPAIGRGATLPGVVGVSAGAGLALVGTLGLPSSYRSTIAVGFVAGIAVTLGSAVGILAAGMRGLGGMLVLGSLVGVAAYVGRDRVGLGAGALGFLATLGATAASPFVAGSTLLVAFAVVGVPHLLVAVAVGSCVGVAVASARRGEYATALGACILLSAGLPATFPRAMSVLLGASLVLLPTGSFAGTGATASAEVSA